MGLTTLFQNCWSNLGSLGRGAVLLSALSLPMIFGSGCIVETRPAEPDAVKLKDLGKHERMKAARKDYKEKKDKSEEHKDYFDICEEKLIYEDRVEDLRKELGLPPGVGFSPAGPDRSGKKRRRLVDFIFGASYEGSLVKTRRTPFFDSTILSRGHEETENFISINSEYIGSRSFYYDACLEATVITNSLNTGLHLKGESFLYLQSQKKNSLALALYTDNLCLGNLKQSADIGFFLGNKYVALTARGGFSLESDTLTHWNYPYSPDVKEGVKHERYPAMVGVKLMKDIGVEFIGEMCAMQNGRSIENVIYKDPSSGSTTSCTFDEKEDASAWSAMLSFFGNYKNHFFLKVSGKYFKETARQKRSFHIPGNNTLHREDTSYHTEGEEVNLSALIPFQLTRDDTNYFGGVDAWMNLFNRNSSVSISWDGTSMEVGDLWACQGGAIASFMIQSKWNMHAYLSARKKNEKFYPHKAELERLRKKNVLYGDKQFFYRGGIGFNIIPADVTPDTPKLSYLLLEFEMYQTLGNVLLSIDSRLEVSFSRSEHPYRFHIGVGVHNWYDLSLFFESFHNRFLRKEKVTTFGASLGFNF